MRNSLVAGGLAAVAVLFDATLASATDYINDPLTQASFPGRG